MRKEKELDQKREELEYYARIVQKLQMEDTDGIKGIMRIYFVHFKQILNLIDPDITSQKIVDGNKVVSAAEHLTFTLRFLATGECFRMLSFQFRISIRAISFIIKSVWNAFVKYLVPFNLSAPSTTEEWLLIAEKFESHC